MRRDVTRLAVFLMTPWIISCGGQPTGACVRGSGIAANCADGFTAGQCSLAGGTAFYQGKTCKELGLSRSLTEPTSQADGPKKMNDPNPGADENKSESDRL